MDHVTPVRRRRFHLYLLLLAAFGAGVLVDRSGWLPGSTRRPPAGLGHTLDPFWETWHLVEDYYVDRSAVDHERMTQGAIEGMLDSLGDVGHTTYLSAEEFQQMEKSLKGEMEGIGAHISMRKQRPTIAGTVAGSPAQRAGLRAGDVLAEVDGKTILGLSLQRIVEIVRGPADTVVHLSITREGQPEPLQLDIQRAKIEVPNVTWRLLPGLPVAHVAIQDFGEQVGDQLKDALRAARQAGARALLLDVRGNPGGLKDQAVAVTSEFLGDGNVFIQQDARGNRRPVAVKPGGIATDIPVCVLIDEGTASSAEIFAGALQDHHRGKLVGARTFGTGTVLEPFNLSDGSAVLLAVEQWLTPNGRRIWHKGISPDVPVELPDGAGILLPEAEAGLDAAGLAKSEDKQLLKALQLLREQIQ